MKIWLRRISILLLCGLTVLILWNAADQLDSKSCSICSHVKCHAPCLLNLATGEIGELELYQPDAIRNGEISGTQTGGTFSFIRVAGLQGIRLTDPWYIEIPVPKTGEKKNEHYYCENCQKMLEEYEQGFVLIDIYDENNSAVYDLAAGASYTIRCYQVGISANSEEMELLIRIDGMFSEGQDSR